MLADKHQPFFSNFPSALIIKIEHIKISKLVYIHKKVQELANGTASARDLNRDLSRFSNPTPIGDRLGGEKFKDRDDGAASCQLLNHFVYNAEQREKNESWCHFMLFCV